MASVSQLLRLVRAFRYAPLPACVGRDVVLTSASAAPAESLQALASLVPPSATFDCPELPYIEGTVAIHGLLDLTFVAPVSLPPSAAGGVRGLVELGLFERGGPEAVEELTSAGESDDCVREWLDDLHSGQTYLRVFLREREPPTTLERLRRYQKGLEAGFWPHTFTVTDACLTNLRQAWIWKHFYT